MAAGQEAVSFDAIIQAGRQKKKNEELASQILGKNRRTSAPGSGPGNKAQNASLASRIGVTKRSASATFKPKQNNQSKKHNQVQSAAPARKAAAHPKPGNKRRPDEDRLMAALNPASGQANVRDIGMTIRGTSSGPFVVIGSNFAPGTTAADIQSAMEPLAGEVLSCWVTSHHPAVTAEITLAEKSGAESIIANFHNQRADGRILSMRFKQGGATSRTDYDIFNGSKSMSSFDSLREQADRDRQNRRAEPSFQDGRYGFGEKNGQAYDRNDRGANSRYNNRQSRGGNRSFPRGGRDHRQDAQDEGLYSDEMMVDAPSQNSRSRGRRQR